MWPLVRQLYLRTIVMGAGGRSTEHAKGDERAVLGQVNHARWTGNATILDLAVSGSRQIEHFLGWGNSSGHPLYQTIFDPSPRLQNFQYIVDPRTLSWWSETETDS